MNFDTQNELEFRILHVLARKRKWGHSHTSIDNVQKAVPPHLGKQSRDALDSLIKSGLILCKPTSYGKEISLNPEKAKEIKEKIGEYFQM
ncbi:MAG: hypothetical protein AABY04_01045 [Candidatus Micrarchaeota archaeon]